MNKKRLRSARAQQPERERNSTRPAFGMTVTRRRFSSFMRAALVIKAHSRLRTGRKTDSCLV
eukprot:481170-Hanusia_phi.AAC.1